MTAQGHVLELSGTSLARADVVAVARRGVRVELGADAHAAMGPGAAAVARIAASDEPAYGVSTGFGSLANVTIPPERRAELQRALIRSHAAGMGPPVEREVVRGMLLLRARTLAMGYSGVRPVVVERLLGLLNAGITPVVPEHGSLGASGDLAPLAHCALVLLGEGAVLAGDEPVSAGSNGQEHIGAAAALADAGIEPLELGPKEGLALINGTDGMLAMLVLALDDLWVALRLADVAAAMSVEALLGTDRAFAEDLVALRPQPGQAASAANMRRLLAGSAIVASHRWGDDRVQDAYSLRCAPQVLGAARDVARFAADVADAELRSAIDNPLILPDGRVESCGNFHGAPLAYACDFLAIACADAGAIAERRTDRMLDATRSAGLPAFLADEPGVNSGLMLAHYTQAAMVADSRRLAAPAAVDSLPTSAMQEDHVSMGWGAARKLRRALENLQRIVAIELTVAARALELRAPLRPAEGTDAARASIRELVPGFGPDREVAPELARVARAVADGRLLSEVEAAIGELA
ncbi:MAG TPA: histidine ammonia-lyase [Thermoleophilaceae bacterium]|nr:histidine ammonia-lyase [Thermoleophilaceae bacterium]